MAKTGLLSREEAFQFLGNDDFLVKNDLIGKDLEEVFADYNFLGSRVEGSLIAVTGIKQIGDRCIESHTYVLPECRRFAIQCLSEQISMVKQIGVKRVVTFATPLVKNFLTKRLGFEEKEDYLFKDL